MRLVKFVLSCSSTMQIVNCGTILITFYRFTFAHSIVVLYCMVCLLQLRAQVVVLKKGLLDEREKHSYIKDNDVGKGQKIRTLEQEVTICL